MEKYLSNSLAIELSVFIILTIFFILIYMIFFKRKKIEKAIKALNIIALIWLALVISFNIDYGRFLKFGSVEEAYNFNYQKGKIIYKKNFEDLVFAYGIESYKPQTTYIFPSIFALFVKDENNWKIQHIGDAENRICITDRKNDKVYSVYMLPTEDKTTTGLFIFNDFDSMALSSETKITDSYNTKYERVEGIEKYFKEKNTHIFFGVVTKKTTDDFYIQINGVKYDLKKYGKFCDF